MSLWDKIRESGVLPNAALATMVVGLFVGVGTYQGCSSQNAEGSEAPAPVVRKGQYERSTDITYFSTWGEFDRINHGLVTTYHENISQISLGDFDGDGDLDAMVGTDTGRLLIYENRISQKKD